MEEKTEYKGLSIRIEPDTDAQSPNEWGDTGVFLVGFDRREFCVEREGFDKDTVQAILNGGKWDDGSVHERAREVAKKYHMFLLEAYIHSGIALSLSREGNFPDRQWDVSSGIGAVFVEKKEAKTVEKARKMARGLIETWNQYLSGDVWGFVVEDQDGEHLDSCWGFYGSEEAMEAAKESADGHAANIKKNKPMYKADAKAILQAFVSDPTVGTGSRIPEKSPLMRALQVAIKNL